LEIYQEHSVRVSVNKMQICVGRFAVLQNIRNWKIRYHNLRVLTMWVLQWLHSATVAFFRQISVANYCVPLNPKLTFRTRRKAMQTSAS